MSWFRSAPAMAFGLTIAIFAAYHNALDGQFLFDDEQLTDDFTLRRLWPLTHSFLGLQDTATAGRPLVHFSFALNYAVGGYHVLGYHLVNIALHALNAIVLFGLVRRTLVDPSNAAWMRASGSGSALAAALLWGLHPIQTEAVSYVTQRTELMMAFFLLTTLYAARRALELPLGPSRLRWEFLAIALCGLGMLCKEVMVTAPVLVFLYDLAFARKPVVQLVRERGRFYVGIALCWLILIAVLLSNPRGESAGFGLGIPVTDYLRLQCWAIPHYLKQSLWPTALVGDYGEFKTVALHEWLLGLSLLSFLAGMTLWSWFRFRPIGFLGAWFFVILAPTSSILPIVTEPVAERRMYLPLASLSLLIVLGTVAWFRRLVHDDGAVPGALAKKTPIVLAASAVVVALVLGISTYLRNRVYQSELTFWTDVTEKRPQNSRGFGNLGSSYSRLGQKELAQQCFQHALEVTPSDTVALCNLGISYAEQGRYDEALSLFDQALAINPRQAPSLYNRGLVLLRQGKFDESIQSVRAAIELKPYRAESHLALGNAFMLKDQPAEAIAPFRLAIQYNPNLDEAYSNLAAALNRLGAYQEAVAMCEKALSIEPIASAELHNLGDAYAALGAHDRAIAAYQNCLNLAPNDAHAWLGLGKVFLATRKIQEARQCFERALQLRPHFPEAEQELLQLNTIPR